MTNNKCLHDCVWSQAKHSEFIFSHFIKTVMFDIWPCTKKYTLYLLSNLPTFFVDFLLRNNHSSKDFIEKNSASSKKKKNGVEQVDMHACLMVSLLLQKKKMLDKWWLTNATAFLALSFDSLQLHFSCVYSLDTDGQEHRIVVHSNIN